MSQPTYHECRTVAAGFNKVLRGVFRDELKGVKRYVDPRVNGVSTKYMSIPSELADRLQLLAKCIPEQAGFVVKVERVDKGYSSLRITVKAAGIPASHAGSHS
jgi:hypothetical protein